MGTFSKPFSEPKLWQFFYQDKNYENIAVGIIRCKEPQRTKKYKRLVLRLGKPNVRHVGFHAMDEVSYFN